MKITKSFLEELIKEELDKAEKHLEKIIREELDAVLSEQPNPGTGGLGRSDKSKMTPAQRRREAALLRKYGKKGLQKVRDTQAAKKGDVGARARLAKAKRKDPGGGVKKSRPLDFKVSKPPFKEDLDEDLMQELLNDPREVVMCSEFLQKEEVDLEEKKKRKGKMPKKFSVKSGDKSKSGGLTAKGVRRYRKANPGSKLKTAVTKKPSKLKKGGKAAKRRKSFCSRMCGMKKKKTGAKTKRDPDSRINKALRKWNCNC